MLYEGQEDQTKALLSKVLIMVIVVCMLVVSIIYLNSRWSKIRDVRRRGDFQSIIKALEFYSSEYGHFPVTEDDDGDGWDKSNDLVDLDFLEPLVSSGLLTFRPFDPKNDTEYYYRYQKFHRGDFGCTRDFAIFQVTQFETETDQHGSGECPDIDFTKLVPNGYTWLGYE